MTNLLFRATNRIAEAQPLYRQVLRILAEFGQSLEAVIEPGRLRCRPGTDFAPLVSDATVGAIVRFVAGVRVSISS